ncbi:Kunitz/Bovine pancreatic trypsin inhibitor domain protein [Cooperia oncophora]
MGSSMLNPFAMHNVQKLMAPTSRSMGFRGQLVEAICSQPLRLGDCKQSVRRYWYNAVTRACEIFDYTGCQGNDNNFETLLECQNTCENIIPEPQCPQGDAYKDYQGNYYVCSNSGVGNSCPVNYECYFDGYVWGCCPTKAYTCTLSPHKGVTCGSGSSYRYFLQQSNPGIHSQPREFIPITYNGLQLASRTTSASIEKCNESSAFRLCTDCDVAYVNPNTNMPYECNAALSNSCPSNFACTYDQLSSTSVCCGATHMDVCPEGEKAYVNAADMSVRECLINVEGSCPSNYLCRFNALKNRYYCCASITGDLCPAGKALFREASSKSPIRYVIIGKTFLHGIGQASQS